MSKIINHEGEDYLVAASVRPYIRMKLRSLGERGDMLCEYVSKARNPKIVPQIKTDKHSQQLFLKSAIDDVLARAATPEEEIDKKNATRVFSPPSGQKVVGFTHWNGRLLVACDYGVWELYDDPEIPGFTRHMEIARGTSELTVSQKNL